MNAHSPDLSLKIDNAGHGSGSKKYRKKQYRVPKLDVVDMTTSRVYSGHGIRVRLVHQKRPEPLKDIPNVRQWIDNEFGPGLGVKHHGQSRALPESYHDRYGF